MVFSSLLFLFRFLPIGSFGILHPAKEMPEFRIIFVKSRFLCVGRTGICGTHPAFYMCRLCGGTCGALF